MDPPTSGCVLRACGILGGVASVTIHLGVQVLKEVGDVLSLSSQRLFAALGVEGEGGKGSGMGA